MLLKNLWIHPDKEDNINIEFPNKITVLLGKNGDGKSTLLDAIETTTKEKYSSKLIVASQDVNKYASYNEIFDMSHIRYMFTSEGERKSYTFSTQIAGLGGLVKKSKKEVIFLLDELDSGLSPDRIKEVVDFLLSFLAKEEKIVRIFITANSYELASLFIGKADFLWVKNQKFVDIDTYDSFIKLYV